MSKIPAPAPGVHPGIPFEDYLRWDAVSQSALGELLRSPAHLQAYWRQPDEDTDALRIGRALHTAVLEPEQFDSSRFGIFPADMDRRTKEGKATWEKIKASGATPLKQPEYERVVDMRAALRAHKAASVLLTAEGPTELSLVWIDEETGVLCKARQDKHAHAIGDGVIVDLKSTTDASPDAFERSIFAFGYHRQGAFYLRGSSALSLPVAHYAIVAQEKEAPFNSAVYRLNEGAIDAGQAEVSALLNLYKRCAARGEWPGYPQSVQDIAIPDWAWAVSERQTKAINEALAS